MFNHENLKKRIDLYAMTTFGGEFKQLLDSEKYVVLSKAMMENIVPYWNDSRKETEGMKKAYYLSSEYLLGRFLTNNLIAMDTKDDVKRMLEEMGVDYNEIEESEEDPALGNGGLGRLAACFLDSAATLGYPMDGYGIRYDFGLFKQKIVDGEQVEVADNWTKYGDPWGIRKVSEIVRVTFKGSEIYAVPYDYAVIGYGKKLINTLRLWKAESLEEFDFRAFNDQKYDQAVKAKNDAENIAKVLYPNDSYEEGKKLRLKQQYFFVSASLQDMIRKFKKKDIGLEKFPQFHSIQLNDTHPAVAIPELMRLLTRKEGLGWDEAWAITTATFAYTNHTLLAEALEQWPERYYQELIPQVYDVITKINSMLLEDLRKKGIHDHDLSRYEIIHNGNIRMAWMSIYGSKSINGVARLHTDLLINKELNYWYKLYPEKFNNKTNGITQRRWLLQSNPELSELVTELLGSEEWITDLKKLKDLGKYTNDDEVMERFLDIKGTKKQQLAEYIKQEEGEDIDPDSLFDIQIKRLHEYKRQLLNAFHILYLYYEIKENPEKNTVPRTFIFGAKAAPGYVRAKAIIKFINDIAGLVKNDPLMKGRLKIVFVQNYRVSYAEKLFPAADLSEQISTAGKEASGTGNMKFMLNGAPTIGTYDGANIEIVEEAGEENNYIFGLRVEDIEEIKDTYNPEAIYQNNPKLRRVMDTLIDGTFEDQDGAYRELHNSLLYGAHWHRADNYFILKDFDEYRKTQEKVDIDYRDRLGWARKCWLNMSNSGKFSSDRTIEQYAQDIWNIDKI
ncbi:glycogen/starch/alpha-glucan phosphorylase [Gudongella sp. DL1XJH-153]|uniref:glycogen/starch/alpha-glucan phosphorylase n=1 Tax=Gudongella sp. DL1XJH-153 TaxID=3409804 RepID=UPI003BB65683